MNKITAGFVICLFLQGCATTPRGADYVPLVDMKGHDANKFATDTQECQAYARQRMSAAQGAMNGAMAGAIAGALIGAVLAPHGYRNDAAGQVAAFGALGGAATGAVDANDTQESITKKCLAGRGYNVLN